MKKIISTLTIGLTISLFAGDFKDEHLKITLTSKDSGSVSKREAEGLNEYEMDVLVTPTTLEANGEIFKYKMPKDTYDLYTNGKGDYFRVFIYDDMCFVYKQLIRENGERMYDCKKATLLEKLKYKFSK